MEGKEIGKKVGGKGGKFEFFTIFKNKSLFPKTLQFSSKYLFFLTFLAKSAQKRHFSMKNKVIFAIAQCNLRKFLPLFPFCIYPGEKQHLTFTIA